MFDGLGASGLCDIGRVIGSAFDEPSVALRWRAWSFLGLA